MNPVGTHGQGCLGDEEYGAVALAMKHNRDIVDAQLTTDQTALNHYNNRPWFQATSTVTATAAQSLGEWTFGTSWYGFTVMTLTTGGNTIVSSGVTAFTAGSFPTGWWNIGGYVASQPTGTITNFTRRQMCIQVSHLVQGDSIYDTVVQTAFESNSGNPTALTVNDMFYLDSQYSYTVTLGFAHRNSGSTVQCNSGARIWLNYLGSGVNI